MNAGLFEPFIHAAIAFLRAHLEFTAIDVKPALHYAPLLIFPAGAFCFLLGHFFHAGKHASDSGECNERAS